MCIAEARCILWNRAAGLTPTFRLFRGDTPCFPWRVMWFPCDLEWGTMGHARSLARKRDQKGPKQIAT